MRTLFCVIFILFYSILPIAVNGDVGVDYRGASKGLATVGCGSFTTGATVHENFDGTDASWTDETANSGVVDNDESTTPSGDCGFVTEWLEIEIPSGAYSRAQTYMDIGSPAATTYARFMLYVISEGIADGEDMVLYTQRTTASSGDTTSLTIDIGQASGQLQLELNAGYAQRDTVAISTETTYCVELYGSNSAPGWEWRIDEVSQGSGADDPGIDFQRFKFGQQGTDATNIPVRYVIDQFDVGTSTWLGCEN